MPRASKKAAVPRVATMVKPTLMEFLPRCGCAGLVFVAHADKDPPDFRQAHAAAELSFGKSDAEGCVDAHDFARGFHLRAEQGIDAGKFVERENRFFDGNMLGVDFPRESEILEFPADHDARRHLGQRHTDRFAHEGHGARSARIDFEDIDIGFLHGKLHVHQAAHVERLGQRNRVAANLVLDRPVRSISAASCTRCRPNARRRARYAP